MKLTQLGDEQSGRTLHLTSTPAHPSSVPALSAEQASEASVEERVWLIQIRSIFKQYTLIAAGATPGALLLAYLLHEVVDQQRLWIWVFAVFLLNTVYVLALMVIFQREWPRPQGHDFWRRLVNFNGIMSGSLWGVLPWLFPTPGQLEFQLMILLWILITPLLVSSALITYKVGYHYYVSTLMILTATRYALEAEPVYLALLATTFLCWAMLVYFTNNNSNTLVDSIRLRIENEMLVNELRIKKAQAEQANQSKSQFLAAASHDLRQPLHAQGLFLEELKACVTGEHPRKVLSHLASTTKMMGKLFDALLSISSLDAGVVEPKFANIRIKQLMQDLVLEFTTQARDKGLELRFVPTDVVIRSDPVLLARILRNFLSNAIRYTAHGRILMGCRRIGDELAIQVYDTGIGIAEDKQREVFQEFHQLSNPERDREKGLGLGLAIVERSAALLGHRIELRSALGKGACFSVVVPIVQVAPSELPGQAEMGMLDDELHDVAVLVIDDEQAVLDGMQVLLERWGCVVLQAGSAEHALALLEHWHRRPDIIVADYRLREHKTGVEAIAAVQASLTERVAAVLITGDTSPERLREIRDSGYRVLHKPVQPAKLRALLSFELTKVQPKGSAGQG